MSNKVFRFYSFIIIYLCFTELSPDRLGFNPTISGWIINFLFLLLIYNCRKTLYSFFQGEYKVINILTLCYCLWMVFATYMNQKGSYADMYYNLLEDENLNLKISDIKVVFWKALRLFSIVLFIETCNYQQRANQFLRISFYTLLIYIIYLDIYTLLGYDRNIYGGKFIISYLNLYLAVIYYRLHPALKGRSLLIFLFLLCLTAYVGLYTKCSTIIIALIPFILLTLWRLMKKKVFLLYKPSVFLISLLICDGILFLFSSWILSFDFIETFIVDVLNEDMTLTGRLGIYETIGDVFYDSPYYGMGIGNYVGVAMVITGCANAQNGLINLFLEVGIIGCILFVFWLILLIKKASNYSNVSYPIIAFIYSELVVSMVEIPFSYLHFLIVSSFLLLYSKKDFSNRTNKNKLL